MPNNLLAEFVRHAEARPHEIAAIVLRGPERVSITWLQLAKTVIEASGRIKALYDASSSSEPRLVYVSENGLSDLVLALVCPVTGLVEVPLHHGLGAPSIRDLRNRSGGTWIGSQQHQKIIWESFDRSGSQSDCDATYSALHLAAGRVKRSHPALILWTSGTTGDPKGVVLSHQNLVGNAAAKLAAVPQSREDVRLTTLPLCHAYARTCDFGTWLLSGCQLAVACGFDGWRTLGSRVHPTLANTVPSMAERLLTCDDETLGMERLRLLGCGGAAMRESAFIQWQKLGVTVIQGYGLTEAGPVICSATPENAEPGLVGRLVAGWEKDIREGQLFVRGAHAMLGYLDDPIATSSRIDRDGWLNTGDIVDVDFKTKQLRIVGRADDMIVLDNGRKIHPAQIERRVEQLADVRYAMLLGSGRTTTLWIDVDDIDEQHHESIVEQVRVLFDDAPSWQRPREVNFFDWPLSVENGEITQKGAIRRDVICRRLSVPNRNH